MEILRAAIRLWHRIILGFHAKLNQRGGDSAGSETSEQSFHSQGRGNALGRQTEVSVDAAKYLGRLSPDLYRTVVSQCRVIAERQGNLITEEMVRDVVQSAFSDARIRGDSMNAKRRAG